MDGSAGSAADKVTSAHVMAAIRKRFEYPGYVTISEFAIGGRRADAVSLSCYPSRGYDLHGFEIKVDRRDWLTELDRPEKAEPAFAICNYWWIAAPAGVVEPSEVPEGWGYLEFRKERLWTKKRAPRTEAVPLSLPTIVALVGSAARKTADDDEREAALRNEYLRGHREGAKSGCGHGYLEDRYKELNDQMTKIHDLFGIYMPRLDDEDAWRSIAALLELRLDNRRFMLAQLFDNALRDVDRVAANLRKTRDRIEGSFAAIERADGAHPPDEDRSSLS